MMSAADKLRPIATAKLRSKIGTAFNLTRLREPHEKHDVAILLRPSISAATSRHLHGFETVPCMMREGAVCAGRLEKYARRMPAGPKRQNAEELARQLRGAQSAENFESLASPLFSRELRRRLISEMLRIVKKCDPSKVALYTIMTTAWAVSGTDLFKGSVQSVFGRIRAQLVRKGGLNGLDGWAILFVDVEYDIMEDRYMVHIHAIVVGDKIEAFEKLRGLRMFRGGRAMDVYRPIVRDSLTDPARQLSYLFKRIWHARRYFIDNRTGELVRSNKRERLPEPRHCEMLLFRAGLRLSDVAWFHNIEIADGRLRPGR